MSSPIINIKNLSKIYPNTNTLVVDQLNLIVETQQIHGLLGPNGAGKTTTINMISNLINISSGDIEIGGLNIKQHQKTLKKIIGLVPQDIALYQELTAYENLLFFGKLHQISNSTLKSRIDHKLEHLGLYEKRNIKIKQYSGGMKRRINLIAGLLHEPKLLILDEPTVGVDVQSKQVILDFLLELNKNGMSLLYTSHLMEEAEKICHRVSIMDHGQIIENGKPEELKIKYQKDNLEQIFIHLTGTQLRD